MMNFTSVNRIITAKDYGGSARSYIRNQQINIHRQRGVSITIRDLDQEPIGAPVYARIWQGQWIADCKSFGCNGAIFVDPDEPIFFCFECLNRANDSKPRPVVFPPADERREIERLLLERPVNDIRGLTDLERAGQAQPLLHKAAVDPDGNPILLPMTRSWEPGQTIDDLHAEQDEPIQAWLESLKTGGADVVQQ